MKLKPITVMRLGTQVDVTDPCYRRDSRALKTIHNVSPGSYDGFLRVNYENEWGPYVQGLWVVKQGTSAPLTLPPGNGWDLLGHICVDSGLAGFFDRKPDLTAEWGDLIEWMCKEDKRVGNHLHAYAKKLEGRDGFWSPAGAGDGDYRYYAYRTDGVITALCLWFDDEE